jgi:Xaa-Pro aminopeptidase
MKTPPRIPDQEFTDRLARTQRLVREAGLDAWIAHSNEADFANVRYLSDYWPIFESAGVLVPAEGAPVLLIGPESETFAKSHSRIPAIRKMVEYREPAEPDYPSIAVNTFASVMQESLGRAPRRIGLAGWAILPLPVSTGLKDAFPQAEIVKADDLIFRQRAIKSPAEVACLREAFRLSELATLKAVARMKPGMTELSIAGVAQAAIYANGAEYEGLPQYVLAGISSSHAIGRPGYRAIEKQDLVQLNLSARIHGYSASWGCPVCVGKVNKAVRALVEFGLEAHHYTETLMRPGTPAKEVALRYADYVKRKGFAEYMLYGPCHGIGMIEVERPWIETSSDYALAPNMTFQLDTFFYTPEGSALARENGRPFGLRWENGCRITDSGCELFGTRHKGLVKARG